MEEQSEHGLALLDICLISSRPQQLSELAGHLRDAGCRPVLTTPGRLPDESEWDAFDLIVLDWNGAGDFPEVPVRQANLILATCAESELDSPVILRAALRAGARDLLPRNPTHPGWNDLLHSAGAPRARVALRFLDPEAQVERIVHLEGPTLTIGRDPSNDVIFPQSYVSRSHLRIVRAGTRYRLVDTGSRHGTFVNGNRIQEHVLAQGDEIQLGGRRGPVLNFNSMTVPSGTLSYLENTNALDRHSVNQEVHDIATLLESFLALDGDLLLEEVLDLILERMIEFVDASSGKIFLRPRKANELGELSVDTLKRAIARDRAGHSNGGDGALSCRQVLEEVLRSGRGVIHEEVLEGTTVPPDTSTTERKTRSVLCVPLKVRGKLLTAEEGPTVIGLLYIESRGRGRPFSPRTLNTLEVLAAEAAMAVHTAQLYEDSLARRRVEEEMAIAREIQNNIFQEQYHSGACWQLRGTTSPSQEVGGDFISCFAIGGDRISVVVGDVSGKGVPAALFSTMFHGLFHGLTNLNSHDPDLAEAAVQLNRFVLTKSRLRKFVTSIFGVLEPGGRFRYVNAGHNPGLLLRSTGNFEELEAGGTILGMFEDATYRMDVTHLESGDLLILYSDGLTDAKNGDGQIFTLDGLRRTVRKLMEKPAARRGAGHLHCGILEKFQQFLGGVPPRDDVTLMVIRRT